MALVNIVAGWLLVFLKAFIIEDFWNWFVVERGATEFQPSYWIIWGIVMMLQVAMLSIPPSDFDSIVDNSSSEKSFIITGMTAVALLFTWMVGALFSTIPV